MPEKMETATSAGRLVSGYVVLAGGVGLGKGLTSAKFDIPIPAPEPADYYRGDPEAGGEVDGCEEGGKADHRAHEEVEKCPLRLVVRVAGIEEPGVSDGGNEVVDCVAPGCTALRTGDCKPVCFRMARCLVCTQLADEPTKDCGCQGREEEAERAAEGTEG